MPLIEGAFAANAYAHAMPHCPTTEHCLCNMEHARGARALREARALPEPDARVAAVAVHLGLPGDAARLYAGCGRWDLVEGLRRAAGDWEGALAVAEASDRFVGMGIKQVCGRLECADGTGVYQRGRRNEGRFPAPLHGREASSSCLEASILTRETAPLPSI